jgi:hypothetical protein
VLGGGLYKAHDMKEEMLKYLREESWHNGRDFDIVERFINSFFLKHEPECSKREDSVGFPANCVYK